MANLKLPRRKFLHLAAGAAALVGTAMLLTMIDGAIAQEPSRRPIRIVVPFPPGGGADVLGRLLAQHITESSRRSVVVENRPGAGSIVGTEVVARAVPDGGTVLIVANAFVVNANLRSLSYDPLTSFEPICLLTDVPSLLVVNSASPFRSLNDFLDEARARPGALSMGTVGPAGVYHVTVETLKRAAKVNLTYVPYPGGAPAINALMGGHITSVMSNYGELIEHVKTGKLRVLAVPARDRLEWLPDVPTTYEIGYKEVAIPVWFGVVAPSRTPKETLAQLSALFTSALRAPEVKTRLNSLGYYPAQMCGADFGAFLKREYEAYSRYVQEFNIKAE